MAGLLKQAMRFRPAVGAVSQVRMTQPSMALAKRADNSLVSKAEFGLARRFAMYKSASPETPLMHYQATQQAQSSMNHRLFWVNWLIIIAVFDIASGMVDI
mmetsp:Transcript_65529/g.122244  ORF Transcript_65529/g.122244 Transcript_65529/m.122244 type:complete len:101 (-) Transcript_65529:78-380(-)